MRFFITLAAMLSVSACMQMTPITESKPVAITESQRKQIMQTVTRDFFDPNSAQFRNLRVVDVTLQDGQQERRVCGEVNGKNQLGGYVGFTWFGGTMQNGTFAKKDFASACEAW